MSNKDLGTFWVKCILENGEGFINHHCTAPRFIPKDISGWRSDSALPLNCSYIEPLYEDEEAVLSSILFMYTEGNYSCDCNKQHFLDRAKQIDCKFPDRDCGDELKIKELWVLKPSQEWVKLI